MKFLVYNISENLILNNRFLNCVLPTSSFSSSVCSGLVDLLLQQSTLVGDFEIEFSSVDFALQIGCHLLLLAYINNDYHVLTSVVSSQVTNYSKWYMLALGLFFGSMFLLVWLDLSYYFVNNFFFMNS